MRCLVYYEREDLAKSYVRFHQARLLELSRARMSYLLLFLSLLQCPPPEAWVWVCLWWVVSVRAAFLRLHGLELVRLLCPWDSPGKNTGVGCHAFQGIFLTLGLKLSLRQILYCRWILYHQTPGKPSEFLSFRRAELQDWGRVCGCPGSTSLK